MEISKRPDKKYLKNLWGIVSILVGAFLMIEHIFVWGEVRFWDFYGHEWLGLILILIGILLNINWRKK